MLLRTGPIQISIRAQQGKAAPPQGDFGQTKVPSGDSRN